jgi:hypothetical protein
MPCPKKKRLTYSFALKDYRDCLVPNGLAVLNVQHSEMVNDKTYNLQTTGHNAVSKDFRWVCLLLFYCMSKKGRFRLVSFPEGGPTALGRALHCGQRRKKTSKVRSFFTKNYNIRSCILREDTELEKRKYRIFCAVLLHRELLQIVFLGEGWHRTLDEGGKDIDGAVLLHRELF